MIVNDNQKPVIDCPTNIVVAADGGQCSKSNVTFSVTANDNCGAVSVVSVPASGSTFPVGVMVVTNTATDLHGNQSVCTFTVTVNDIEKPVINCSPDKIVEAGQPWVFDTPSATDNCSSVSVVVVNTFTNIGCGTSFSATRTWRATDASGNFAECSQTVQVLDRTAPIVTIVSPTNGTVFVAPASFYLIADANDVGGSVSNVEFFVGATNTLGATNLAPYLMLLTNVEPGTYSFTAKATDGCGNAATSAPVTITVLPGPPITYIGPIHFQPQTGLFTNTVRVFNPTYSTFDGVRVYISNLTANTTVYNASGITNGVPFVQSNGTVPPGSYVDFVIEYYVHNSGATPNPTLWAELISAESGGGVTVVGTGQHIDHGLMLADQTFLIEFKSVSNRVYYVQYSSDLTTWQTVEPSIRGNGTSVQWVDNGQPKTESAPAVTPKRFYRVIWVQ